MALTANWVKCEMITTSVYADKPRICSHCRNLFGPDWNGSIPSWLCKSCYNEERRLCFLAEDPGNNEKYLLALSAYLAKSKENEQAK